MTDTPKPAADQIRDMLRAHLNRRRELPDETTLANLPNFDSLDLIEVVMAAEEITGREITDAQIEEIRTVGDLIAAATGEMV